MERSEVSNETYNVRDSKFILVAEDLEETLLKYKNTEATDNDGSDKSEN